MTWAMMVSMNKSVYQMADGPVIILMQVLLIDMLLHCLVHTIDDIEMRENGNILRGRESIERKRVKIVKDVRCN